MADVNKYEDLVEVGKESLSVLIDAKKSLEGFKETYSKELSNDPIKTKIVESLEINLGDIGEKFKTNQLSHMEDGEFKKGVVNINSDDGMNYLHTMNEYESYKASCITIVHKEIVNMTSSFSNDEKLKEVKETLKEL
jgi:hypothetical protein